MTNVEIEPGKIPACPECGEKSWSVVQVIRRSSDLIRVDSFTDLIVQSYDIENYSQKLQLNCIECGESFLPNYGITARAQNEARGDNAFIGAIEAYHEKESGDAPLDWPWATANTDDFGESW